MVGAKAPVKERQRRRPFRRGRRGGNGGARNVRRGKLPQRETKPKKASLVARGNGSRSTHFIASATRAADRLVRVAEQCVDIKRRAQERRDAGVHPALPHKALVGLSLRQHRLLKAQAFWGDAYASWRGESRVSGRRWWRDLLRSKSVGEALGPNYPKVFLRSTDLESVDETSSVALSAKADVRREWQQVMVCMKCGLEGTRLWVGEFKPPRVMGYCPEHDPRSKLCAARRKGRKCKCC